MKPPLVYCHTRCYPIMANLRCRMMHTNTFTPGSRQPASHPTPLCAPFRSAHAARWSPRARAFRLMRLKGHRAIFCAIDTDASMHGVQPDARVVQELLDSGADAARTDDAGRTPLHAAAECGAKEVAQVLIAAGAPLEARDCDLRTPLHSACGRYPQS